MFRFFTLLFDRFLHPLQIGKRKKGPQINISKRQKFVASVFLLSGLLFIAEYIFTGYTVVIAFALALLTSLLLFFSLYSDMRENFTPQAFILPFFCSLAFGLFYFLTPSRLISRLIITTLYGISLYSIFLSENIFVVASSRTIALINSARIVTFVITLISYFFLSNIIFSLRLFILPTVAIFFIISLLFTYHALWTYTLEKVVTKEILIWVGVVSVCIFEMGALLWFWPTSPTVMALFMTAVFYVFIGLSHMWFEKRLFRSVFWEYAWVAFFAFIVLLWFTHWQG